MRADAARNHAKLLQAADRVIRGAADPAAVTMEAVAAAAGVGKGTLFRRFGDRTGLLRAVHAERSAAVLDGLTERCRAEPDAVERAVLVVRGVLRFKLDHRAVSLALESAGAGSPYDHRGYDDWFALLRGHVADARGPALADYLTHALLAATRSDLVEHLREVGDEELLGGAEELVRSVLAPAVP